MTTLADAIAALSPGAKWALRVDGDLSTLEWLDLVIPRPTDAAINAKITELDAAATVEVARLSSIRGDAAYIDLLQRLRSATSAQIDNWVDNNVTNVTTSRAVFKAIIKLMAIALNK